MEEKKYYCPVCGEELEEDEDEVYRSTHYNKKENRMIYFEQIDLYCNNCGECVGQLSKTYYLTPRSTEVDFYK